MAAIKASEDAFPSVKISGCLFHLGQSMQRQIQARVLAISYRENRNVRNFIKALIALAFVPVSRIRSIFSVLESIKTPNESNAIYDYFFSNYMGDSNSEISIKHHFRIWNASENLDNDYPRTNNTIEGLRYLGQFSAL